VKILFNYTGDDGASLYLDDISVEETPTAPNCVENVSPTGTDVSITNDTVLITWDAPSTGEAPTGYEVFWGQTPNSLTSLGVTTNTFINIGGSSVDYGNTNYYSIVAQNNGVSAVNCTEYSYIMKQLYRFLSVQILLDIQGLDSLSLQDHLVTRRNSDHQ
jgi:hypothetical protein